MRNTAEEAQKMEQRRRKRIKMMSTIGEEAREKEEEASTGDGRESVR